MKKVLKKKEAAKPKEKAIAPTKKTKKEPEIPDTYNVEFEFSARLRSIKDKKESGRLKSDVISRGFKTHKLAKEFLHNEFERICNELDP